MAIGIILFCGMLLCTALDGIVATANHIQVVNQCNPVDEPRAAVVLEVLSVHQSSGATRVALAMDTFSYDIIVPASEDKVLRNIADDYYSEEYRADRLIIGTYRSHRMVIEKEFPDVPALPRAGDSALLKVFADDQVTLAFDAGDKYTICTRVEAVQSKDYRNPATEANQVANGLIERLMNSLLESMK